MTQPKSPYDTRFAKDVAKRIDRRRMRRRLLLWVLLLAAVVFAVTYLRCGGGWGFGGAGKGEGAGAGAGSGSQNAGATRCKIRIAASGITVDGKPGTRAKAVAACKTTAGAEVTVTGDARQGDWDDLRTALDAAHIPVFKKDSTPGR